MTDTATRGLGATRPDQAKEFFRSARIQTRVIGALLMREIITRYGRRNIGFMWIFVEPMLVTAVVVAVWALFRPNAEARLPLVPFMVTGWSSLILWRHIISRGENAIEPNRALLHHRNVRVIDIFAARVLLEIAGTTISFMTLSSLLAFIGLMSWPDNVLKMMTAWLLLAWFAAGMGMLIGSASAVFEVVGRIWQAFSYPLMMISGAFFMVDWLPTPMQEIMLYIPMIDCTELFREGYFGIGIRAHYDVFYVVALNAVLTLLGLAAVRTLSSVALKSE
jgi:capsular polysaccharide transport system permease protein